ncbi:hypothetical protein KW801_01670 [Candidatus Saccharibacteria bacterium]|nr:hypothetical protein [Candidatus Saccharibacteria bacterium]
MAIQEYAPFADTEPLDITIWPVEGKDPLRSHTGEKFTEYYISIGQTALGLLHWEVSNNDNDAYIDGIDPHPGIDEGMLDPREWEAIAVSMHGLTKEIEKRHIRRITHPAGSEVFLEAL